MYNSSNTYKKQKPVKNNKPAELVIPKFSPDRDMSEIQSNTKASLFSLSREHEASRISEIVSNWIKHICTMADKDLTHVYSVINFYCPDYITTSHFKDCIVKYKAALETEINYRNRFIKKSSEKDGCSNDTSEITSPASLKAQQTQKIKDTCVVFSTDFPSFSDGGFPDISKDIFKSLLTTKNKKEAE